ncbi:MAG: guanylate kinase [Clostridiaceae bacterium]|jgi:guanylate kinase|nr:guanylate kinase [Clostridiaceae bacterium]
MTDRINIVQKVGITLVVSGPSGVGKNSVINALRERYNDIRHSVSVTTRPPREAEIDGVHYYFRTKAEFEAMIAEGEILEYDIYCGEYYGTPRSPLERMRREGINVLLDLTVKGALSLKESYPNAVLLFLIPPSETALRERLLNRATESQEIIQTRLSESWEEMNSACEFDYLVVNDDLLQAVQDIEAIYWAEKHRTSRLFIDGMQ